MKTKHYLTALVLPAVFAACSSDELFDAGAKGELSSRPTLGNVTLNIPEGPQTRWEWDGQGNTQFEVGEKLGAVLMDIYASNGEFDDKYTVVDKGFTNYPFVKQESGSWQTEAIMVEGNYFFYLPYDAKKEVRSGFSYSVPVEQYTYDKEAATPVFNARKSMYDNQLLMGYDGLAAEKGSGAAGSTDLALVPVHATPYISLSYTGSDAIQITRIVLRPTVSSAGFDANGAFTPAVNGINLAQNAYLKNEAAITTVKDVFKAYNAASKADQAIYTNNPFVAAPKMLTAATTKVPAISVNFPNSTLSSSQKVSAYVVVPAGVYTTVASGLVADIYTDRGLVQSLPLGANGEDQDLTGTTGGKYSLTYSNVAADKMSLAKLLPNDASKFAISFNDKAIIQPSEVTISTTSQLESIIKWYTSVEKTLKVITSGNDVVLSKAVYDVIKGNSKLAVTFEGTITIPADVPADAISLVSGSGNTATIIIATGAKQTIAVAKTASISPVITNNGTLSVNITDKITATFASAITNNSVMTVTGAGEAKVVLTTGLVNYGALTNGATIDGKIENEIITGTETIVIYGAAGTVTNNGTLNLAISSANVGTITNNANINITGVFTNKAAVPAVENGTNGHVAGTITNNADGFIIASAALTNSGNIKNKGTMYSLGTGAITNAGYIMAYDKSTTYVSVNENGDIELEKRTTEVKVDDGLGSKSYTLLAGDLEKGIFTMAADDKFNTLKVGMDAKINNDKIAPANIVLNGTAATELAFSHAGSFTSLKALGGKKHTVRGTKIYVATLTVADANTTLQIPVGSEFGVYGTVTAPSTVSGGTVIVNAKATILVGGAFHSSVAQQPTTGNFAKAGDGSYKWGETALWGISVP